ncbi:MAG: pantoate--beta-alanine ligase, partial [Phaeodactylibacter sp.]|nr:pantoate--beta-alanine ligase [Phaeodactylibacter sp.]
GQKDYQQFSIIRAMLRQLKSDIELVVCPIVRESDGLAMSSRNTLLTSEGRREAPLIHATLDWARSALHGQAPAAIQQEALERLAVPSLFTPEYFEIVDGTTLEPVDDPAAHDLIVACTAVRVGEVRLIDNQVLKGTLNQPSAS